MGYDMITSEYDLRKAIRNKMEDQGGLKYFSDKLEWNLSTLTRKVNLDTNKNHNDNVKTHLKVSDAISMLNSLGYKLYIKKG